MFKSNTFLFIRNILIIFTYLKLLCINILTITIKITQCPRGEIGRHKGLKSLGIHKLLLSQTVSGSLKTLSILTFLLNP